MVNKRVMLIVAGIITVVVPVLAVIISYCSSVIRLEHFSFIFVIVGAIANVLFFLALLRQIRMGRKSLELAQDANEITRRTSIDNRVPSVVPKLFMDDIRYARHLTGNDFEIQETGATYVLPKDKDVTTSFCVRGSLTNEGSSTAQLHTQGNVTFAEAGVTGVYQSWNTNDWRQSNEDILLSPGETRFFTWADGHTVQQWYDAYINNTEGDQSNFDENSGCKIQFRYWDFQHQAYDYIDIEIQGYPIKRSESDHSKHYLDVNEIGSTIYPVQRFYGDSERVNYKSPYAYRHSSTESKNTQ